MSEFTWSENLSIGVPSMDKDHQMIIQRMNQLAEVHENGAPYSVQKAAFNALADVTRKHFSAEEEFMASLDYTGLGPHRHIHTNLLSKMNGHFDRFMKTQMLDDEIFAFLTFWLKSHICGIDRKYGELAQQTG